MFPVLPHPDLSEKDWPFALETDHEGKRDHERKKEKDASKTAGNIKQALTNEIKKGIADRIGYQILQRGSAIGK
ncbi:MAG: hypothetical protein QF492_08510 [Candidatus Krumholzibacteria bacterium]|nr:hypothetical protein [Candidatus Krumholzibacteria bacterium]MDP6669928.1 hypothetical protein [Candidatus Krumholzibacteria bacterium]MDP6797352.1 hypothetical protein [Candidatus Krumholzibacteria bacterium]MDP7020840.1 hypothetical protein [Candidatus Krumholzibacteria bacterium]